jgi:hypothetical protein
MIENRAARVRGIELEGGGAAELRSSSIVILIMTVTMPLVFATT